MTFAAEGRVAPCTYIVATVVATVAEIALARGAAAADPAALPIRPPYGE